MPEYRADILETIGDVVRRQPEIFGASQKKEPLTSASKGWKMPNMAPPPAPADGVHTYAAGDEMRWVSADGGDYSLKPAVAPRTEIAPNMTAGAIAPADYDQSYIERLREDVRAVRQALNEQIINLRTGGLSN